jgi:hypothetical protein
VLPLARIFPCSKEILVLARNLQGNEFYKEMSFTRKWQVKILKLKDFLWQSDQNKKRAWIPSKVCPFTLINFESINLNRHISMYWKIARVTPTIYKSGAKNCTSNYRPISVIWVQSYHEL